jgi:two-component system OmpR family response regulator
MRVLVIENDLNSAKFIRRGLMAQGFAVDVAMSGEDALWMAGATAYDAIALEAQLAGIDGFETCRRLRDDDVSTPVLMLSARDRPEERVAGLDGGADDYLVKPFHLGELAARVRALMRRGPVERPTVIQVGDLRLDPATCAVWRGTVEIELSAKPYALLVEFMRRPNRVLSRFMLLEYAWDREYENRSNVVDVHIAYLRDGSTGPSASNRWRPCAGTATGSARSRPGTPRGPTLPPDRRGRFIRRAGRTRRRPPR